MHYTRNKTRNHANHIREYQSQLWKDFLSLRTLQRSLIQTATLYKHLPFTISMPYIYNSTRRDQRKNQRTAWFPESSNQTAANQSNGRCSPTAFEVGYSVLAETWTNFLVTNQGTQPSTTTSAIFRPTIDSTQMELPPSWHEFPIVSH